MNTLTCFLEVFYSGSVSQLAQTQNGVVILILPLCGVEQ